MSKIFIVSIILFIGLASGLPKPGHKPQGASDDERKLINTPVICKNGEEADANGNCQDVLNIEKRSAPEVSIVPECLIDCTIPGRDCPEGQEMDENGNCRDSWGRRKREAKEEASPVEPECIIGCNIPERCPDGQKPDQNGNCRDEWGLEEKKDEKEKKEESILTRALKPKKSTKKRNGDETTSKPEGKSMKIKVAAAKAAKAKMAKAKIVKGKTFLLIKKKKKMKPTTVAPEEEPPAFPPPDQPFPFPEPPQPDDEDEGLSVENCESGDCKLPELERKLKTIQAADTWENWFDDSDEESLESDSWEDDPTEEDWGTEEVVSDELPPEEIDEELLEKLIEMKVMKLMQMLEMRRKYGPLLAQMMSDEVEEDRKRKHKKKKRS